MTLVESRSFWRPYEQTYYTIAVLEKTAPAGLVEWPNEEAARLYGDASETASEDEAEGEGGDAA